MPTATEEKTVRDRIERERVFAEMLRRVPVRRITTQLGDLAGGTHTPSPLGSSLRALLRHIQRFVEQQPANR